MGKIALRLPARTPLRPFRNGRKKTPRIAAPMECPGATRQAGFPVWLPGYPSIVHPIASVGAFFSSFRAQAIPAAQEADQPCLVRARKTQKCLIPSGFSDTYPFPPSFDLFASPPRRPIRSARAARRSAAACFRTAAASGALPPAAARNRSRQSAAAPRWPLLRAGRRPLLDRRARCQTRASRAVTGRPSS